MITEPAVMPVTMPVGDMDALPVPAVTFHVPPAVASVILVVTPSQTLLAPLIVPAAGCGLTVIVTLSTRLPQLLVIVFLITTLPDATPVTTPVVLTEPADPTRLQVPEGMLVNGIVVPAHTLVAPLI